MTLETGGAPTAPPAFEAAEHQRIEPAILYLGTPVALVSTLNADGAPNLAPMSSAWWLGWSCMLGFVGGCKTVENLLREGECVLNLPSSDLVEQVDRLAGTTGMDPEPAFKKRLGFHFVKDKFGRAGLTPQPSIAVKPPRVLECPIQLEAKLVAAHPFAVEDPRLAPPAFAIETRVTEVHVRGDLLSDTHLNRIDPQKWSPLIMSFLEFFARGEKLKPQTLRRTDEEAWGGRRPELRADAPSTEGY